MNEFEATEIEFDFCQIGERVRQARTAIGITQKALSERCGCNATHISNLEKGKIGVSLELLYKISVITGKPMDFFVMDEPLAGVQHRIDMEVAPLLDQCDPQTPRLVTGLIKCCIENKSDAEKHKVPVER